MQTLRVNTKVTIAFCYWGGGWLQLPDPVLAVALQQGQFRTRDAVTSHWRDALLGARAAALLGLKLVPESQVASAGLFP